MMLCEWYTGLEHQLTTPMLVKQLFRKTFCHILVFGILCTLPYSFFAQFPPIVSMGNFHPAYGRKIIGPTGFPGRIANKVDFNGDGIKDIFMSRTSLQTGEAYVVFGSSNPDFIFSVDSLDGNNGFRFHGALNGDGLGYSIASAGDINGDGREDIIAGASFPFYQNPGLGRTYIIYGASSYPAEFDLDTLNGVYGFSISGMDTADDFGFTVSGAGDINADGIDDILVGAPKAFSGPGNSRYGVCYVVFGKNTPFAPSFDLSSLDGSNGFVICGDLDNQNLGFSVSGPGDMNGDSISDLVVGVPRMRDLNGPSYTPGGAAIVFGAATFTDTLRVGDLNGSNGFIFMGAQSGSKTGWHVTPAGDTNNDGKQDILVGSPSIDGAPQSWVAESYLVLGKDSFPSEVNASWLPSNWGRRFNGIYALSGGSSGRFNSGQVDVNHDGMDDMILYLGNGPYSTYSDVIVMYGSTNYNGGVSLSNVNGTNGFRLRRVSNLGFGAYYAGLGDVNNDGIDDFAITSSGENTCYIVYGTTCWPSVGTDSLSFCNSTVSQSGNQVWAVPGNYLDTIPNSYGCDSIIEVGASQIFVDTLVSLANNDLSVGVNGPTTFQWLDCNNGNQPIAGATSSTYSPMQSGSFAVMVTTEGCTQTSGCHTVTLTDRAPSFLQSQLSVSPNPSSEAMFLDFGLRPVPVTLEWYSADGRLTASRALRGQAGRIEVTPEQQGFYFLKVTSKTETAVFKLLRQ